MKAKPLSAGKKLLSTGVADEKKLADATGAPRRDAVDPAKCPKRTLRHNAAENVLAERLQGGLLR